jgi:RNA polymerase sigma-70 factor (ECF subfamily)
MTNYSNFTDHELTVLLAEGDQIAFTEIFDRYKVILYKHACRLLNNYEEANDVIQDIFTKLWEKRDTINLKTSLSSYLYSAVRNRIFNLMSHQKVVSKYLEATYDFEDKGNYIVDEQIMMKELATIIEREIDALPPKMREVFKLSREKSTYKEIAQVLNISDKTVKQQVHNAVKILKVKVNSSLMLFLFF